MKAGAAHFSSSNQAAGLPADYTFTAADNSVHTFTSTMPTGTVTLAVSELLAVWVTVMV